MCLMFKAVEALLSLQVRRRAQPSKPNWSPSKQQWRPDTCAERTLAVVGFRLRMFPQILCRIGHPIARKSGSLRRGQTPKSKALEPRQSKSFESSKPRSPSRLPKDQWFTRLCLRRFGGLDQVFSLVDAGLQAFYWWLHANWTNPTMKGRRTERSRVWRYSAFMEHSPNKECCQRKH